MPSRIGRYRVVSLLDEGGMSRVYRAVDTETGESAAVKVVVSAREINYACLRREVHALSKLRHQGIVRIRDHGVSDGVPWYAMDLIAGTSLRRMISPTANNATRTASSPDTTAPAPRPSVDLHRVLVVLRRLCSSLSYLHAEGIVHRDLKPENVVVAAGDEPVIIDFGLAAQLTGERTREAIAEDEQHGIGTFGYMAPEQRRGEAHDARVDIYAFGCMLYEALTGQLPILEAPVRPSHVDARTSPALDALVMRLLSPEPRERLGYMEDVETALSTILGMASAPRPLRKPYVYRPTLIGRDGAMGELESWLVATSGGLALVSGESGSGKTRFVMEVGRRLTRSGARVIAAECAPLDDEHLRAAPLHPLAPTLRAIADHCRTAGAAATERILGRRLGVLAAYEPALRALLPQGASEPEPLSPQSARARLYADLAATLTELASEQPLVLVIDDLQWMDELTATFLTQHLGVLRRSGVRVLGTYRREAIDALLEGLMSVADVSVGLGRLDQHAVAAMVSDMLAIDAPPEPLVRLMHDHSEGNPLFVAEYVRAAVHANWLARDREGRWQAVDTSETNHALPLPVSLRDLLSRRLGGVSEAAELFIAAAAVLGREVTSTRVAEVVSLDPDAELRVTRELMQRQVLEEVEAGRLCFSHDKLRELAYERLDDPVRRQLHGRAASSLERSQSDNEALCGVIAYHFREAGETDRAVDYLERAGEHALRTAAHGQAQQFFGQALALAQDVEELRWARWMRRSAEAAFGLGDISRSETQAFETLARLRGGLPPSRTGWVSLIAGGVAKQVAGLLSRRGATRSGAERERNLEGALAAGQLASTYYFTGDALRMVGTLLLGVNLADRAGSPAAVVESHARLGYIAGVAGVHPAARHYFLRANTLARGQTSGHALALYLHAFYHLGLAEWSEATDKGRRAVDVLLANGDRQDAEIAQTIAAHAVYYEGHIAAARQQYERVHDSARARGNAQHEAWGLYLMGRSDLARGEIELALDELAHAHGLLSNVSDRFSAVMCGGLRAEAFLANDDLDAARTVAHSLEPLIANKIVPLAPCVHGYVGRARVLIELSARAGEDSALRTAARSACDDLSRFARVFPMARSAALRLRARQERLEGQRARARAHLDDSIARARRHRMPYDEGLAYLELAEAEEQPGRAQARHTTANALFAKIGARTHH